MKKAKLTAVCGMMCALSVVLMSLATFLPVLMYVLPIITGVMVYITSDIGNIKWGFGVYCATAVISLILITDKESALTYALFFGYYPLIRDFLERLPKILKIILKLVMFNCAAVLIGFAGVYVFGLSSEEYSEFGKMTIPILLGLANVVFIMYDTLFNKWKAVFSSIADRMKKILK